MGVTDHPKAVKYSPAGLSVVISNYFVSVPRGGLSEARLLYENYFHTLNGAQNIGPLIEGIAPFDAIWVKKRTLNRRFDAF